MRLLPVYYSRDSSISRLGGSGTVWLTFVESYAANEPFRDPNGSERGWNSRVGGGIRIIDDIGINSSRRIETGPIAVQCTLRRHRAKDKQERGESPQ